MGLLLTIERGCVYHDCSFVLLSAIFYFVLAAGCQLWNIRILSVTDQNQGYGGMGNTAIILDVRGLNCPLPVLKTKKAMRSLVAGDEIWVETTDPLSAIDIPAYCENDGHALIRMEKADGYQRYLIKKQGS